MFDFEPGYWLIVSAVGIFFLTVVVVVASSMITDDDDSMGAVRRQNRLNDEVANASVSVDSPAVPS